MKILSRILKLIATGTVSLVLAACYGVSFPIDELRGTVRVVTDIDEPIPDLRLTFFRGSDPIHTARTSYDGDYTYYFDESLDAPFSLTITDTDGAANLGSFPERTVWIAGGHETVRLRTE